MSTLSTVQFLAGVGLVSTSTNWVLSQGNAGEVLLSLCETDSELTVSQKTALEKCKSITETINSEAAATAIINSRSAMAIIANSSIAITQLANSYIGQNQLLDSSAAKAEITNSNTAMTIIASSGEVMTKIANSSEWMSAIIKSTKALDAVINSETAMDALENSFRTKKLSGGYQSTNSITGHFLPLYATGSGCRARIKNMSDGVEVEKKRGRWLNFFLKDPIAIYLSAYNDNIIYYDLDA